jgi:putative transposase
MKLSRKRLINSLAILENGGTVYKASKIARITVRYMYFLWNQYKQTGKIPVLGIGVGRPIKQDNFEQEKLIKESYEKYKICASRLHKRIKIDYKTAIPVYTIHKTMLKLGLAKLKGVKDVRKKKWVRYEREHSLTAVHIDWVNNPKLKLNALPVIDDSSRKLLALVECEEATTDASIDAMKEAMKHGEIKQCISDHGTQFIKDETKTSRFTDFLKENKIKHILCRIKHPQSNGKSEKFNHLYLTHRTAFKTKEEFINWYNNIRPHMSLDEITPEEAYQKRKHSKRRYYT